MFFRDTWAKIELDHIYNNVKYLREVSNKAIFAVVKANGYGIGDDKVAIEAIRAGVVYLAVSSLDEALALRYKHIKTPILVLGYTNPQHVFVAKKEDITLTATSLDWAKEIKKLKIDGLTIHIKIDTGMNRLGFKEIEEVEECLSILKDQTIEGIYSHFARSDDEDDIYCNQQLDKFKSILSKLNHPFKWIHISNSDAAIHYHESICNAVRCGIAMLGYSAHENSLKPVLSLFTKIVHIKQMQEEEAVSYGGTYIAKPQEWIATVPIGYADGWLRTHQDCTAYINGKAVKFVGRICMDQSMLKVDQHYPIGTIVELIGENSTLQQVASDTNTIPYEVICGLNKRIAKVFYRNHEIVEISNPRLDELTED